jgi:hypothetical protein
MDRDNKLINNYTKLNDTTTNSSNINNESFSQIAERLNRQKDLMMSQMSKK